MKLAVGVVLAFALTLVMTGAARLGLGPERGPRLAGAAVMAGFLVAWAALSPPPMMPVEPFGRAFHIALGAGLIGALLDYFVRRTWASIAGAVVIVAVCAFASVTGSLWPHGHLPWERVGLIALLAAVALASLARLDRLRSQADTTVLIIIAMLAAALSTVAAIAGDALPAATALMLSGAVLAYGVMGLGVALPVGDSIIIGAGMALLALVWAVVARDPAARPALVLLPLILFADGTARRVPLPKARISAFLYPLILAGTAALPLVLAALVAWVTAT